MTDPVIEEHFVPSDLGIEGFKPLSLDGTWVPCGTGEAGGEDNRRMCHLLREVETPPPAWWRPGLRLDLPDWLTMGHLRHEMDVRLSLTAPEDHWKVIADCGRQMVELEAVRRAQADRRGDQASPTGPPSREGETLA